MQTQYIKCQEPGEVAPRRRLRVSALLAASALLLVACGGGGSNSGSGGSSSAGNSSTGSGIPPGPGPEPEPKPPPAAFAPAAEEARSGTFKLLRASASNGAASAIISESAHYRLTREELTP